MPTFHKTVPIPSIIEITASLGFENVLSRGVRGTKIGYMVIVEVTPVKDEFYLSHSESVSESYCLTTRLPFYGVCVLHCHCFCFGTAWIIIMNDRWSRLGVHSSPHSRDEFWGFYLPQYRPPGTRQHQFNVSYELQWSEL